MVSSHLLSTLDQDFYYTREVIRRLGIGLLPSELYLYLNLIEGWDELYMKVRPELKEMLANTIVVTDAGPMTYHYDVLEANFKVLRLRKFSNTFTEAQERVIYDYLRFYRPKLWRAINLDWLKVNSKTIHLLERIPSFYVMTKHVPYSE